ncbi:MAG: T9SS type A sorting domain-containing protein [Bacteroidota bacterium]
MCKALLTLLSILLATRVLPAQIFEAETATLSGVNVFTGRNASNNQYTDFQNPSGDFIEWELPANQGGPYRLTFIYQLGKPNRPLQLDINGTLTLASLDFPSTGNWVEWDSISAEVTLVSGLNTIRLTAIGNSGANFDFLRVSSEGCEGLTFSDVISYAGAQDKGSFSVLDQQKTLLVQNNAWKAIPFPYTLTPNTRIDFDFRSDLQGEEHAFGFSTNLNITNSQRFKLFGTQNTAQYGVIQDYNTYASLGSYQRFSIPVGTFYTGPMSYLFFTADNDVGAQNGDSYFSNVLVYEDANQDGLPDDCGQIIEVLPPPSIQYLINFSDSETPAPEGWLRDVGTAYGAKGTISYGWVEPNTNTGIDLTAFGRNRPPTYDPDVWRETLLHLDHPGNNSPEGAWEIGLPNGVYRVSVQVGDPNAEGTPGTRHVLAAEGITLIDFEVGQGKFGVRNAVKEVTVSDGRLTLDALAGINTKIHFVVVESIDGLGSPIIVGSTPIDGAENVATTTTISANFLNLPNQSSNGATSLDNSTISSSTVQLFEVAESSDIPVLGSVNGTGGGDAINFSPTNPLKAFTRYRYVIKGVKDLTGTEVLPFSTVFTTGESSVNTGGNLDLASFDNAGVVSSGKKFTTLTMGPEGKLYGLTISGDIHRWAINSNGTLANEEILDGWKSAYANRTAIGLVFDPTATASNLIAYVSHCSGGLNNAPAWDGKLSRITGTNLQTEELLLTNLPRSIRDHLTNSIGFRPGEPSVLYFLQGSNSAGGAADGAWGNRPERLLTAAFLRLDLSKLPSNLPLDVQTSMNQGVINSASINSPTMSDGSYNPYYIDAPLTLYATGVRNAYDFVWHSNGQAYIATNGTAGGSNSPASITGTRRPDGSLYNGQSVPALTGNQTQRDWLFRVNPTDPFGYYGHPNPLRGEYVLNRGPLDEADYPASITPDANYRGAAFDFEFNKSPNGIIEYRSPGNLQGAMLVCRYSGGSDLIALVPDGPNGDINTFKIGIPGFTGFDDPLDLTEDLNTGNLYVSDYGRSQIVLLKPAANAPGNLFVSTDKIVVDEAVNATNTFSITLSNTGGATLSNVSVSVSGDASFNSSTTNLGTLNAGTSVDLPLSFSPSSAGPKFASLSITANGSSPRVVQLNGLGTSGEPSLQRIFDTHLGVGVIEVDDDNDGTSAIHSSQGKAPLRGDEVPAQAFTVADPTEPVSMEMWAVFGPANNGQVSAFGWYEAGNPANRTELLTVDDVPTGNRRSLNPITNGTFSFNPNTTTFGFFGRWPAFNGRLTYTEDAFNTFADNIPHHIRAFPVPGEGNVYVLAIEEATFGFDYQDNVVLVRNVVPVGSQTASANSFVGPLVDTSSPGFSFEEPLSLTYFPNPLEKQLVVTFANLTGDRLELKLTTTLGKVLYQNFSIEEEGRVVIQTSSLAKGVYFLCATSGETQIVKTLMKVE